MYASTTLRSTPLSLAILLTFNREACEKLAPSKNREKKPMLRTKPSSWTSSRTYSET